MCIRDSLCACYPAADQTPVVAVPRHRPRGPPMSRPSRRNSRETHEIFSLSFSVSAKLQAHKWRERGPNPGRQGLIPPMASTRWAKKGRANYLAVSYTHLTSSCRQVESSTAISCPLPRSCWRNRQSGSKDVIVRTGAAVAECGIMKRMQKRQGTHQNLELLRMK